MSDKQPRTASDPATRELGEDRVPPEAPRTGDARSLRSRASLREALLRLIERRPFDKITVRAITAEAGVSYPTFFNHYESKEALFQEIARAEISDYLVEGFRRDMGAPDWRPGEGICAYIGARRALWQTLLTAGAVEAMRSEFIRRGRELAGDRRVLGHEFPIDLVSGVIASGTFEIVAWWLAQAPDYPTSRVADMLEALVIEPALALPPGHFTTRNGGLTTGPGED